MPCCLLSLLAIAFPRAAIVLLWLFTNFFRVFHHDILIPLLGFIFLPLTLLAYTYLRNTGQPMGTMQLVILFIALLFDFGLIGGGGIAHKRRFD